MAVSQGVNIERPVSCFVVLKDEAVLLSFDRAKQAFTSCVPAVLFATVQMAHGSRGSREWYEA